MNDIFEVAWLVLLLLFSLGEALTVGLTSIWFAAGALAALVCALLGRADLAPDRAVLGGKCAVPAGGTASGQKVYQQQGPTHQRRPYSRHGGAGHRKHRQYPGQRGGDIGGVAWSARSEDGTPIPAGSLVRILRIEGVKVFVELSKEESVCH